MSTNRSRKRRIARIKRRIKTFFGIVLTFIAAVAFVFGGLFALTKLPADESSAAPAATVRIPATPSPTILSFPDDSLHHRSDGRTHCRTYRGTHQRTYCSAHRGTHLRAHC